MCRVIVLAVLCTSLGGGCLDLGASPEGVSGESRHGWRAAGFGSKPAMAPPARRAEDASAEAIDQLRAELLDKIQRSPCPGEPCPVVAFTAQPAPAVEASRGKRILLIDDAIVLQGVVRWPGRVIGVLGLAADGAYHDVTPPLAMARDALDVFATIDGFPAPVLGTDLDIASAFFTRFSLTLPADSFGHGMDILPFLAERIPGAQFVLSEDQMDAPTPCELIDAAPDSAAWSAHDAFVRNMATTLARTIVDHGINYVHLSWGIGQGELSNTFVLRCGRGPSAATARRYMEPYVALLTSLTSLTTPDATGHLRPVIVFQAGARGTDPDARRLDCAEIANRVRVFSVPYIGTAVPAEGSHDYSLLPTSIASLGCNDVFIVMGYTSIFDPTRGDQYFPSMPFGLGRAPRPAWPPASSFANPIALAHFVRITQDHPCDTTEQWLDRVTDDWSQPILDPLLYNSFPSEP